MAAEPAKPAAPAAAASAAAAPKLAAVAAAPPAAAPTVATGPISRRLRKGDILFSEGENSRAMYLIKSGMVRLFKKKGDTSIELATVHAGEILGELAFLDGNPRSASGEALTECQLIEITVPTFQGVLGSMPDWLKIMLKTVVGRLRTASTRIRQLETASTALDYSEKDGKRQYYVYISAHDAIKIGAALLLVCSRNAKSGPKGIEVRMPMLEKYGASVLGVPAAKVATFVDLLGEIGVISIEGEPGKEIVTLKDIDFLDTYVNYQADENQLEPSKRHDLTNRGMVVMTYLAKHLTKGKKDEVTGLVTLNVAEIRQIETQALGREAFRLDEYQEIAKFGYASQMDMKSGSEVFIKVSPTAYMTQYKLQKVVMSLAAINEQKRKGGK